MGQFPGSPRFGNDLVEEATASSQARLARNVDATQESAEVSGKSNDYDGHELQRQAVSRKQGSCNSPLPKMNPANQKDKETGGASERDVEQQKSSRFVPGELPLPRRDAGSERR